MPDLKLIVTAQIPAGPALSFTDLMTPEGYGQTKIPLIHGTTVKIRLASDAPDILMVTSEKYSTAAAKITMETGPVGAGRRTVELIKPLFLSGGAIALLGNHQGEITLIHAGTTAAHDTVVTILSAGDVTP